MKRMNKLLSMLLTLALLLTLAPALGATASWFARSPDDRGLKKLAKGAMAVLLRSRPLAGPDCTGCGKCARDCPAKAIEIRKGKAHIDRRACIRCFCCQEFCPTGGMKAHRALAARITGR